MRKKQRASIALNEIVYGFIRERRAANSDAGDLLSMLLFAKDEAGQSMTDRQLHDEVMTIFIAGHETTAVTLAWIFVELARHPEVETRLHAELDSILNGRPATLSDLANLPYTELIVKETLRLYPPAWLLLRSAKTDLVLGNFRVPRGNQIWISPHALHRNPRFYAEPNQFQPERFGADTGGQNLEDRLSKFAYIPFGGGPRICIGNQFALLEARLLLATIAQHYRLAFTTNNPVKMHVGPTLGFENGVRLLLKRRV
jgi:cytochrome P450